MAARRGSAAQQIALLRRLCHAVAVSGDEGSVRKIILDELKGTNPVVRVDPVGNLLLTRRGGPGRRLRVMLDAHMDEVGFMLVADDGDGLYQFRLVGGIDVRSLPGKRVVVGPESIPGVIGLKPVHLSNAEDLKRKVKLEALRVDMGPGGKAKIGDRGTFAPDFRRVGPSIMSKALDNRLGVATLIELFKSAPRRLEVQAAFTVQEEIGLRGAGVAARHFSPDLAIILDATPAYDLPMQHEAQNNFYNVKLGLGPAIYVADHSTIDDPRLVRFMMDTATRAGVPFQLRQPGGGGTNAGAIQRSLQGVPVVTVSVPHRYSHTATSVARLEDWQNTILLLESALRRLTPQALRRFK
ncbi:MAG: M42 family metallopeptidase [Anaerolineales bacterium]